jgi:hypothetical protein
VLSSADSGAFVDSAALGRSTCTLTGFRGSIVSTANGAAGSVTGANVAACSGLISRVTLLTPAPISIAGLPGSSTGTVTFRLGMLIVNVFGGQCLYAGTFTGTLTRPASSFTMANQRYPFVLNLNGGLCFNPLDISMIIHTRAVVTWP